MTLAKIRDVSLAVAASFLVWHVGVTLPAEAQRQLTVAFEADVAANVAARDAAQAAEDRRDTLNGCLSDAYLTGWNYRKLNGTVSSKDKNVITASAQVSKEQRQI